MSSTTISPVSEHNLSFAVRTYPITRKFRLRIHTQTHECYRIFIHIRMQITLYLPVLASLIVYITQKISEIDVSFVGITYVRFNHV